MATTAVDLNRVANQSTSNVMTANGQINNTIEQLMGVQQANNAAAADMAGGHLNLAPQPTERNHPTSSGCRSA